PSTPPIHTPLSIYPYAHHRVLHSFPTRRSSDLRDNHRVRDRSANESLAAPVCVGTNRRDRRSDVDPHRLEPGAISKTDYSRHHQDRKSTRLTPVTVRSRMPSSA